MKHKFLLFSLALCALMSASFVQVYAQEQSGIYLRGTFNEWQADPAYEFLTDGTGNYWLTDITLSGEFKVADETWSEHNYGSNGSIIAVNVPYLMVNGMDNISCGSTVIYCERVEMTISGSGYNSSATIKLISPSAAASTDAYYPIRLSDYQIGSLSSVLLSDLRINNNTSSLYIWEDTYNDSGDLQLEVKDKGWAGAGWYYSTAYNDVLNTMLNTIKETPSDWHLRLSVKSSDQTSHAFTLFNSAIGFTLGTSMMEGFAIYQDFERDGTWHTIDVPFSYFGEALQSVPDLSSIEGINVLSIISQGIQGAKISIGEICIYKGTLEIPERVTYTVRLDSMSYEVRDWENAYAFIWTGNTDAYYAYYQYSGTTRILWGERAVLDENGYYTISFETDPNLEYHVGWRSSSSSYPDSYWCVTNVTGSVCCEYINRLIVADCFEEQLPMDTVTVRLNPFAVEWGNAYAYAWRGTNSYSYADRSRSTRKLTWATEATMDEEGWFAVSFTIDSGAVYTLGWSSSDNTSYFYSSDTIMGAKGSICTTMSDNKMTITECTPLIPTAPTSFIIHEVTAGTLGQLLVSQMNQWTDVLSLKVVGTMNAADMELFSYMTELQRLDLSETDITSITGCRGLAHLREVVLPSTCTVVEERAFQNCKRLQIINLEHVLRIGNYAFCIDENPTYGYTYLTCLTSVNMPLTQSIGNYAFSGCWRISECNMESVVSIGECAFANCCYSLTTVNIPNATSLGVRAFYMCDASRGNLTHITFSDDVEVIPDYFCRGSAKLTSVVLPSALKSIGSDVFYNVTDFVMPSKVQKVAGGNFISATSVTIPASIVSWAAFSSTWENIYCYAVDPAFTNPFDGKDLSNMTLYVPSVSLAAYKLSDNFHGFKQILPLDAEVSSLNIRGNLMLLSLTGISENADVTLYRDAELTVSSSTPFDMGDYTQYISTFNNKYYTSSSSAGPWYSNTPCTGMLMANSAMSADSVVVRLVPRANRWNFFSLPFDVNMQDIILETEGVTTQGTSQWVIREYSGANRASGTGSTWENVPANGTLQAHKGYILYWTVKGSSSYNNNSYSSYYNFTDYNALYYFHMPAADNANKQNMFAKDNVNISLSEYPAEAFQNSSWNLIGNPYPCALSIQAIDFNAPITTWNGNTYVAYSLQDDDYVLRPAEAFFVQAPQGETDMTFNKSGRSVVHTRDITKEEYNNYYNAPKRCTNALVERKIFNFYLSNDDYSDRARLVLNEQASTDYEITCDAAKMFSSDNAVPQLFINNNDVLYAIDERPIQNRQFVLGAVFGESGQYTLSLERPANCTEGIVVLDTETGVSTDLTTDEYTFTTESGTFDSRFVVSFVPKMPTDIDSNVQTNMPVKVLRNGHMIIYAPNGKTYTVEGQEL